MPTPRPLRAQSGFSLIEALIAAAIFAFIMLGTVPLFIRSLRDTARNRNQLHFNQGAQAVVDELTTRTWVNAADPVVADGWHVYSNATLQSASATTPKPIADLMRGSSSANPDRVMQNNLLGQVQYNIYPDLGRRRVDVQVFYFESPYKARSMSGLCSGTPGINTPGAPSCNATTPPAFVSVVTMSSYIDMPVQP